MFGWVCGWLGRIGFILVFGGCLGRGVFGWLGFFMTSSLTILTAFTSSIVTFPNVLDRKTGIYNSLFFCQIKTTSPPAPTICPLHTPHPASPLPTHSTLPHPPTPGWGSVSRIRLFFQTPVFV